MRFVSLFAGIGGFDLGLERAGHECIGQVEIDKHAQGVLTRHWPDVPRHDDVRTAVDWANRIGLVGRTDLVCGGFPCQDVSRAGKRAGLAGERSGLFWDALAFSTHVEAGWFVLENVPGLLSSNDGEDFGVVISAMADAGYRHIEWRVLDSQFFGVPQRRRRVFIVGRSTTDGGRQVFVEREGLCWNPETFYPQGQGSAGSSGRSIESVDFRHGTTGDVTSTLLSKTGDGGPSLNHIPGALTTHTHTHTPTYWDGTQTSDCLDVSMLVKGQMMPEKRRMPAVIIPRNQS